MMLSLIFKAIQCTDYDNFAEMQPKPTVELVLGESFVFQQAILAGFDAHLMAGTKVRDCVSRVEYTLESDVYASSKCNYNIYNVMSNKHSVLQVAAETWVQLDSVPGECILIETQKVYVTEETRVAFCNGVVCEAAGLYFPTLFDPELCGPAVKFWTQFRVEFSKPTPFFANTALEGARFMTNTVLKLEPSTHPLVFELDQTIKVTRAESSGAADTEAGGEASGVAGPSD